jgi:hypothetical protein
MTDLAIDLLNLNINPDDECMICKESLNDYPCYCLPECNHKYHTHCLISWFRNGDSRCPYCGNKGINNKPENKISTHRRRVRPRAILTNNDNQYILDLKKFINLKKNKDNPQAIKILKQLDDIKKLEIKFNNLKKEFKEYKKKLKTEPVNYETTQKTLRKYKTDIYNLKFKIRDKQLTLIDNSYIIPLIVPIPIDIN